MYEKCCKKCGSISLHTEVKGNNTGLYCDDCGAFQKWLGKDELKAFKYSQSRGLRSTAKVYDDLFTDNGLKERLQRFVKFLDKEIDKEMTKEPLSPEDAIRKSSYCLAMERNQNSILNILEGREFNDLGK